MNVVRPSSSDSPDKLIRVLVHVLFALSLFLVALRFVNLGYDSPLYYSGYSASEISDPYMYTSFARNKILFDEWDPYHYARWDSWRLSIVSGFSFLVFLVAGVSRVSANVSGLLLQLGGFLFFLLALARYRPRIEVVFAAFLLLSTSGLFFAGRIPLLENGIIFLSGLTVWLHCHYRDRLWGAALTGAMVVVIALAGKLIGVALLAPLLIDTMLRGSGTRSKAESYKFAGSMIAGFVICGFAYSQIVYGMSLLDLFDYFRNQTAAVGLTPRISGGGFEFLASILLYGSRNGLFRFQPIFITLTGVGLLLVVLRVASGRLLPTNTSDRFLLFVSIWFLVGLVMLLPYSYRPSRYFMPLMLPGAALSAYALAAALRGAFTRRFQIARPTPMSLALLLFCSFVIVYLSVAAESSIRQFLISENGGMTKLNLTGVGTGLGLSFLLIRAVLRGTRIRKVLSATLAMVAIFTLVFWQTKLLYAGLSDPHDPLRVQVQDVGNLIGPEAVIAGTYGPAFTIDNGLRNLIHPFAGKLYEKDFFTRFPVTHIAVALSEMKVAQSRYPALIKAHQVATVWTRDGSYLIYRVPEVDYVKTDYESGMDFLAMKKFDSSLFYFNHFLKKHPESFRARITVARILAYQVRIDATLWMLRKMSRDYEDYFYVHLLVGREYVTLYRASKSPQYKVLALASYSRALELNPYVEIPKSELP